jgi:hypothetical protein
MSLEYEDRLETLKKNQKNLFNIKDIPKWENPEIDRMTEDDKKNLVRDKKNIDMILPGEQKKTQEIRLMHAHLVQCFTQELSMS